MAQKTTRKSDVLEREYTSNIPQLIFAIVTFFLCLLSSYFSNFLLSEPRFWLLSVSRIGAVAAFLWGVVIALNLYKSTRELPSEPYTCPYCDRVMQVIGTPSMDFDCEYCKRKIYFEAGVAVPVRDVTCTFCKTVHRVAETARMYTCDRCNRLLKLREGAGSPELERSDVLQNYDVVLTDVGRKKNEVALALESILICNLVEARRQMENLPLTVMRNVPERKADAVRLRLRDLGATAVIRPTTEQTAGAGAR